jgi:hypothetical protein
VSGREQQEQQRQQADREREQAGAEPGHEPTAGQDAGVHEQRVNGVHLSKRDEREQEDVAEIHPADRVSGATRGDQRAKDRDRDAHRDVEPRQEAPGADVLWQPNAGAVDQEQDQGGDQ